MKSSSGSDKAASIKWRRERTLRRAVDFRPIEDGDMRFIFAAYKKGALAPMGQEFADGLMGADEFKEAFEKSVVGRFHAAWSLFAMTKRGFIPVGIVFGSWPSPQAPYMLVDGMCWFPWASKRNIVETIVGFLNGIRKELQLQFYALPEHKKTYEVCAMHGVVRRVGTSYVAFPGKAAAIFETRAA